jgi:predicted nucleotidyltransferase
VPARDTAERAAAWATEDDRVSAAIVYGSVARGDENEWSDLDLVIVTRAGQRDAVWAERHQLAARLLDSEIASAQEPTCLRPFGYQDFGTDLVTMLDLTLDEVDAWVWAGIVTNFTALVDKDGASDRLASAAAAWVAPEFDAAALDPSTWPWFAHLDAHLRRGHHWIVRAGLYDTLGNRVVALLGAAPNIAESALSPEQLAALYDAAPRSSDADELRRAMRATVELYDHALDVWAARTGRPRPQHPLAPSIRQRVAT